MSDSATEEWRPVVGWEGLYEVSNLGRVRSVPRDVLISGPRPHIRRQPGKVLQGYIDRDGYHILHLFRGGARTGVKMHRLVCEAFHGPAPESKPLVLHGERGVSCNYPSNLRWGSQSDNLLDAVRHGRHAGTRKTHCIRGHEYTPSNTLKTKKGSRRCRECHRTDRQRARENSCQI